MREIHWASFMNGLVNRSESRSCSKLYLWSFVNISLLVLWLQHSYFRLHHFVDKCYGFCVCKCQWIMLFSVEQCVCVCVCVSDHFSLHCHAVTCWIELRPFFHLLRQDQTKQFSSEQKPNRFTGSAIGMQSQLELTDKFGLLTAKCEMKRPKIDNESFFFDPMWIQSCQNVHWLMTPIQTWTL